jgi:hypothetical protein
MNKPELWVVVSHVGDGLSPISVFGPFASKAECETWINSRPMKGYRYMPKLVLP